jgi:hypothetical protein
MKRNPDDPPRPPADPNAVPQQIKIFPRNLTARADYVVRGNPANSRPESGVNNSFPGLEFDTRTLEERFFPGLAFDFLRDDGAVLTEISPESPLKAALTAADASLDPIRNPLYLWALYGRTVVEENQPDVFDFYWYGLSSIGPQIWRRVNALLPGRVAIALGPPGAAFATRTKAFEMMKQVFSAGTEKESVVLHRDPKGKLEFVVLAGKRADYLSPEGVLDVGLFPPGDLTKSMCAPWMYDFRDCFCFYWAANKPDLVASPDGAYPYVDFLRKRYPTDGVFYPTAAQPQEVQSRYDQELDYDDMVEGWWERLPVVLNGREDSSGGLVDLPWQGEVLDRDAVVAELRYLAMVEHALMVEYLYAYYSLKVWVPVDKMDAWEPAGSTTGSVQGAADQLMQVAKAEMRHFLWANLALRRLQHRPSLLRATKIAEPPSPESGRKVYSGDYSKEYLHRDFILSPLDRATLDWFIEVEAPSRVINEGLDGMYVEILESVKNWQSDDLKRWEIDAAEKTYLVALIKLIIDEGHDHFLRFRAIRSTLAGLAEQDYLRRLEPSVEGERRTLYCDLSNELYRLIIGLIGMSLVL